MLQTHLVFEIQSLILIACRLTLGAVFLASSVSKVKQPRLFSAEVVAYKLIPNKWSWPIALTLMSMELVVAVLLLIGWQSRLAAFLGGLLLVIFTIAIGFNLLRGRADLECGCFGKKNAQKIGLRLIARNLILLIVAVCITLWGGSLLSLDNQPFLWKRLFMMELFLPLILVCVGTIMFFLLTRRLYRLLLLTHLEE